MIYKNAFLCFYYIRKRTEWIMTTNEKALLLHEEWKGKLETTSKAKVASREDLAPVSYTHLGR